ncbi:hypothetical protein BV25DRAFT_1840180 [Artomyces pyxidatus]|uniref:Uncharacterized protein n=1 Tax=Artomyces pyxidatus TaxID=48021 RepID=A0ACB8STE1_9AGAM|nr:hypothetical protein BV25DRAFT_1840180 [Artomyces pyxidatus]
MRVSSLVAGCLPFVALIAQAAPLLTIDETDLLSYIKGYVQSTLEFTACPAYEIEDRDVFSVQDPDDIYSNTVETFAGDEYWFRFEDPSIVNAGNNILPLATRPGAKDYDDQAYKWISNDASKVTRNAQGRWATLYVLPSGTRADVTKKAEKFEVTSEAKRAAQYVTKDHEPGDNGVNGVAKFNNVIPLDDFRSKVKRTVILRRLAGGKFGYTTITKGKRSDTATKDDQKALERFK